MEDNSTPQKNSKWRRPFKILGITGLVLAALLLVLTITAFAFEDKIADIFLQKLYHYTTVEITHRKVSFSLIKRFPAASLEVNELNVQAANGKQQLLEAQKVYLQCNLLDVVRGNYTLRKVEIDHARLALAVNEKGKNNWDIFIHQDSVSDNNFKIALNTILLHQVYVSYNDAPAKVNVEVFAKKIQAKGDFDTAIFSAQIKGNLLVNKIEAKGNTLLTRQNVALGTTMHINTETEHYSFTDSDIKSDFLHFALNLDIKKQKKYFQLDIDAHAQNASIANITSVFPQQMQQKFSDFAPEGLLTFEAKINGLLDKKSDLNVQATYQLKKGKISNKQTNVSISDLTLDGSCHMHTYDMENTLEVNVNRMTAKLNKGYINANARMQGLEKPTVSINADADIDLNDWQRFMPENYIHHAEGNANIQIQFNSKIPNTHNVTAVDLNNSFINGKIEFSDATIQLKDNAATLTGLSGVINMEDKTIYTRQLQGIVKNNTFSLNGRIENIFPYLLDSNESLQIIAYLNVDEFSLDELLKNDESRPARNKKNKDDDLKLMLPSKLYMDVQFSAKHIVYRNFEADKTAGRVVLNNNTLSLSDFEINALDGKMVADCKLQQQKDSNFRINCHTTLQHIDIQQLFYAVNNFGQQSLTHKNIQGIADCTADINATLQNNMKLAEKSIVSTVKLRISNGQLINFKALESLSKFISINELRNIQFETLNTQIQVADRMISIPQIDIRNNVLNLSLNGTHSFDNDINYHIQLSLGDLLSKKARANKRNKEDFGEIIDDNAGKANLFIAATSNLDKPVFKWDSQTAQQNRKLRWEEQKQEIQEERQKKNDNTSSTPHLNTNQGNHDLEIDDNW
ncbi:MAG: AsmA family protein [Bacteroidales bacterium]|nr:AsmA family protein [Bacteroidales bacterium]